MNPFAAINDGLIDITWIDDSAYSGVFGVTGVMSEARSQGGIQAYGGHSQYVRGRKIRVDVPATEPVPAELELDGGETATDENGEPAATKTPERPQQVIMIDGEALNYQNSVIWECFPANIEVLIDDALFKTNKTFPRSIAADDELNRLYTDAVDKVWFTFDSDNSGQLDKNETRTFLKVVLGNCPPPNNYDDTRFDETFLEMDANGNGMIEKDEMVAFIKKLTMD